LSRPSAGAAAEALAHLGFAALAGLVLAAAAQPLQTDDAWWHLALGRSYASSGPWLAADPLLHTAKGPPAPAAWLADLGLHALGGLTGFQGLRVAHVALVAAILALAWSLLHRASGSRSAASLLAAAFAALSAYRLYQLRPELATILATLVLYRLVLESAQPPGRLRSALAVALLGVWANLHSGFALGPILLAAAAGGCLAASVLGPRAERTRERARGRRLALVLALGLLATLANPSGIGSHLAYFEAGRETPDLARVADEWARIDLFRLPVANLPPSPLAWGILWVLVVLAPAAALAAAGRARRGGAQANARFDPALVALAAAGLAAPLLAVRFLWLGLFPLLLLARNNFVSSLARGGARRGAGLAAALASPLLVAGFVHAGDWPMLSATLPRAEAGWAKSYAAAKYHAAGVGVLADAGLEGNLYNDYFMGGFLGYWLAPRARAFVNGSLNLPIEALSAYAALGRRRGTAPGESFLALLDRYRVDLFLGVRLPVAPRANRPWIYTTAHLERTPGWLPAFRAPATALYLHANERNTANLERLAAWYAREGVPFDPERGFDTAEVIRRAPEWAVAHGVIPRDHAQLLADSRGPDTARQRAARGRLASLDVALGLYEQALELDAGLLRETPDADAPQRRRVWSLLRLGRNDEARQAAQGLVRSGTTPLSRAIAVAAARAARGDDPEETAARLARLPVFTSAETSEVLANLAEPPARPWRGAR
jgi:hypothetical protein